MIRKCRTVVGLALGTALMTSNMIPALAQTGSAANNPLGLRPPSGLDVIPIMEGAYDNEDGSFTVSFGYHNRNSGQAMDIPFGPNNYIEPSQFDGMQPTHFATDRHTGVFTVTVPASMRDESIWWYIKTGNNEILKVPGRIGKMGYTLDKAPRPQGSISPRAWFVEGGPKGSDPEGLMSDTTLTVAAGESIELTAHADDPSIRDMTDPRNAKPIPLRVSWWHHQGDGSVTFTRHETTPEPEEPAPGSRARRLGEHEVKLNDGKGTAHVYATFSQPGEYMIRTLVDNWDATDSTEADQCCWTNLFQKVTVTP